MIEQDDREVRIDIGDPRIDRSCVENFLWGKCRVGDFNLIFGNLIAIVGFGGSRNGMEDAGGNK